ncbi:ABC transporter substrate-binding protein [Lysinibacillus sp. SGAir0095]|uniref:ABC transporter substrate-binding protein n=1 Tax=Lysinibacillus sp. SGAir0095 TaxID=2070463 RepID=UPI0010CD656D|nr:ABC transporter substrate-binding protein [Lysinibacillus sp. SGAir0095]QCR30864.1 iron-uptake system-binding protein [Lysinibacillus sp. SGAir0095]
MKRRWVFGAAALLTLALAGCGSTEEEATNESEKETTEETTPVSAEESKEATTQTITYLGEEYTVPAEVNTIVAASLEAMEDAAILGIKPAGVLQIGGEIPAYLADDLAGAELIGDKREPNAESILALDPDVIVGTSKFGEDVVEKMNKIQTMIPYSHISTNWKENLTVLAQLGGKESEAEQIIADYEAKVEEAQSLSKEKLVDKEILIIRIRGGLMYIYPKDVYLNPVLYEDLGAQVPEIITQTEAQAEITLETLAEVNPDTIFLQFETSENADAPKALEELQSNPIFANLAAAKNDQVLVNTIDPLAQGGTAWSKVKFLDAAYESLLQ